MAALRSHGVRTAFALRRIRRRGASSGWTPEIGAGYRRESHAAYSRWRRLCEVWVRIRSLSSRTPAYPAGQRWHGIPSSDL